MSFIIYDLVLLAIFAIFIGRFLYKNKKELKKEGLLLLYKTKLGMKLIDYVGGKYKKTLKFLSYVSIAVGYLLMAGIIYFFGKLIWLYVLNPEIVKAIKIPPIMPLIPYLPQMFKLDFLPPFYFIYWILILAVVAIVHEFAHGIFMKRYGIKIKSTGFGFFPFFLPIFLAAFVEQDEKSMQKASKFKQMAVLSAGTFANVLTGFLFFLIIVLFFSLTFTSAGVSSEYIYSYSIVGISAITSINNVNVENLTYNEFISLAENSTYNYIEAGVGKFVGIKSFLDNENFVLLYNSAPAINNNISGAIIEINGELIKDWKELGEELAKYSVGEEIGLTTKIDDEIKTYNVVLEEHPEKEGQVWLGIGFLENSQSGIINQAIAKLGSFKDSKIYYESNIGDIGIFVYDLLWWIILISFSIALVNMLPVGIFDGGRFFHLTIWGLTKNEKFADRLFSGITWLFLAALLALMFFWAKAFF